MILWIKQRLIPLWGSPRDSSLRVIHGSLCHYNEVTENMLDEVALDIFQSLANTIKNIDMV